MTDTDGRPRASRESGERLEEAVAEATAAGEPFLFPDFDALLDAAAASIVGGAAREDFVAGFVAAAPEVAPLLGAALRDSPEGDLRAAFARRLWDGLPRPDNRFRPDPAPTPARNDPCPCGSGRKYKQCCLELDASLVLPPHLLLVHVLDTYPDEALETLDGWTMDIDGLLDALVRWTGTGREARAVRLAAPMFAPERRPRGKLPRHAADVLEILLDAWPPGFRDAAFDELVERLGEHRDERLAAAATEAGIRRRFEGGDERGAWSALRRACRRFPDDIGLVELEIDLLNAEGRFEESMALAGDWHERLTSIDPGDEENAGIADALLERAADVDPETALERARAEDPVLDRLVVLLHETPPGPIAGTHDRIRSDGELVLGATPALREVEARWEGLVATLSEADAPDDSDATEDVGPAAAVDAEPDPDDDPLTRLVSFLDEEPLALSSFAVLETLALTVDRYHEEPWAAAAFVRVLLRGERLLYRHVSREQGFETPEGLPDWQAMVWETAPNVRSTHPENHAALALLGALADWYEDTHEEGEPDDRLPALAAALHGLDPEDDRDPSDAAPGGR